MMDTKTLEDLLQQSGRPVDVHTETAKRMFNTDNPTPAQRHVAKQANYWKIYGGDGVL